MYLYVLLLIYAVSMAIYIPLLAPRILQVYAGYTVFLGIQCALIGLALGLYYVLKMDVRSILFRYAIIQGCTVIPMCIALITYQLSKSTTYASTTKQGIRERNKMLAAITGVTQWVVVAVIIQLRLL